MLKPPCLSCEKYGSTEPDAGWVDDLIGPVLSPPLLRCVRQHEKHAYVASNRTRPGLKTTRLSLEVELLPTPCCSVTARVAADKTSIRACAARCCCVAVQRAPDGVRSKMFSWGPHARWHIDTLGLI